MARANQLTRFSPFASYAIKASLVFPAVVGCMANIAAADMTLTSSGISRFGPNGLSVFASGFIPISTPGGNIGPFGIDYEAGGNSVLIDTASGNLRRFQANSVNVDAQTVPILRSFGQFATAGITHIGTSTYMGNVLTQSILQLNSDGTTNRTVAGGIAGPTGLVADPVGGDLFCSTNVTPTRILRINSTTGATSTFQSVAADGLTLSADRSIL